MLLEYFKDFPDFELLDSGNGFRLERFGKVRLKRPDPQAIWEPVLPLSEWKNVDAEFGSKWLVHNEKAFKGAWTVGWRDTRFLLKLSPFKHTGLFSEQAANWEWLQQQTQGPKAKAKPEKLKILNLFGYTGGASMILTKAGCFVTHVDASKPTIGWAKENQKLNRLPGDSIRWILDDAAKFVKRELKRGGQYDGILMDPPAFGHSPTGTTWRFNDDLPDLLRDCVQLLSPEAKFLLINGYATNSSALALKNVLEDAMKEKLGSIEFGELCLKQTALPDSQKEPRLISTGIFARWSSGK